MSVDRGPVTDLEGDQWTIATRKEDLTQQEMKQRQGEFFKQVRWPLDHLPTASRVPAGEARSVRRCAPLGAGWIVSTPLPT